MHRKAGWLAVCLAVRLVWLAELTISSSRFVSSHPTYLSTSSQPVPFRSSVPRSESVAGTYTRAYVRVSSLTRDKGQGQGARDKGRRTRRQSHPSAGGKGLGGSWGLAVVGGGRHGSAAFVPFYFILFYFILSFLRLPAPNGGWATHTYANSYST